MSNKMSSSIIGQLIKMLSICIKLDTILSGDPKRMAKYLVRKKSYKGIRGISRKF